MDMVRFGPADSGPICSHLIDVNMLELGLMMLDPTHSVPIYFDTICMSHLDLDPTALHANDLEPLDWARLVLNDLFEYIDVYRFSCVGCFNTRWSWKRWIRRGCV